MVAGALHLSVPIPTELCLSVGLCAMLSGVNASLLTNMIELLSGIDAERAPPHTGSWYVP